ncbi:hypothetical protein MKZ38_003225 [Zalerion maritima]|uniref:Uncharacterized protein n=1 Tax=Zalerion maritima TaxID=339359 RepID=A0AAD5RZ95_9PEZI|nr:hypothetical protein MKZ38_003225 [Zalerion maritima]
MEKSNSSPAPAAMHSIPFRRSQPFLVAAIIICGLFYFFHTPENFGFPPALRTEPCGDAATANFDSDSKVPLEAHIMSKCPDARDCLKQLVLPAMQTQWSKVDFKLSFIGQTTDDDGVQCKHGPAECMGNIIMLCAAELYPDPKTFLGFTMCLERDFRDIAEKSLIEDCALEHAIDIKLIEECASRDNGAYGMHKLRESVSRTADVSGVSIALQPSFP